MAGQRLETLRRLLERGGQRPQVLNDYARDLLTIEARDLRDPAAAHCVGADWPPGNRDDPRPPPTQPTVSAAALPLAERACALAEERGTYGRWNYLDTLALAQHMTGDTAKAIETQRRALALIPPEYHQQRKKFEERLAEYEAALVPESAPAPSGP